MSSRPTRRPWERVVRIPLARPERVTAESYRPPRPPARVPMLLALGFLAAIAVGSLLLSLPLANRQGVITPPETALFTATSAVCVTGLVVVDTLDFWSPFGQAVILLLMEIGGLGFLTSSTILLLLAGRRVSLRERVLLREAHGVRPLGGVVVLTRQVVAVTLSFQGIGALILSVRFAREFPPDQALWMGVFHGISAFNNAGFDLMGDFQSLTLFSGDPVVLLTVASLVLLGAISFTVIADLATERRFSSLLLDSKLVLVAMASILAVGTFVLLAVEYDNPNTLGPMGFPTKLMNAFFMTTSRTSGFSSIPVADMAGTSLTLLVAMMYIGGAAGSMAGGIKLNTFALLAAAVVSSMRGRTVTSAFGREVPPDFIYRALTVVLLSLALVFGLTLALSLTEPFTLPQLVFESISAFSIVGLSTGITPDLSLAGKLLIAATMYVGRVGPLTLALALAERESPPRYRYPEGWVKIG